MCARGKETAISDAAVRHSTRVASHRVTERLNILAKDFSSELQLVNCGSVVCVMLYNVIATYRIVIESKVDCALNTLTQLYWFENYVSMLKIPQK